MMKSKNLLKGSGFARGDHSEKAKQHAAEMRKHRRTGLLKKGSKEAKDFMKIVRDGKKKKK